jgi:hypothetical protein
MRAAQSLCVGSAGLLVAWVATIALIRGVRDIVLAFIREVRHVATPACR